MFAYLIFHTVIMLVFANTDLFHIKMYAAIYVIPTLIGFLLTNLFRKKYINTNTEHFIYIGSSVIQTLMLFALLRLLESYFISLSIEGSIYLHYWSDTGFTFNKRLPTMSLYLLFCYLVYLFCFRIMEHSNKYIATIKKSPLKSNPILRGSLVGFLIWVYDYDFFINFGGPETPISDMLCDTVSNMGLYSCGKSLPVVILVVSGAIISLIATLTIQSFRKE